MRFDACRQRDPRPHAVHARLCFYAAGVAACRFRTFVSRTPYISYSARARRKSEAGGVKSDMVIADVHPRRRTRFFPLFTAEKCVHARK